MKFAYADPPYYGQGKKDYGHRHDQAHIWDTKEAHLDLLNKLNEEFPDGWVLSCNPRDLRWLLPALPEDVRVGAWTKTYHQIWNHVSVQYSWEAVIWRGGRAIKNRKPMVRDWTSAAVARNGFKGAKSSTFNRWLLDLMGYEEGDEMVDLFPGSNSMARELSQGVLL